MTQISRSLTKTAPAARDHQYARTDGVALNAEGATGAPEWVMLWPQGRLVVGRDKRSFTITDPEAVIAATKARLPLLIDYEHDTEFRKPGDVTPAAGWIVALEAREGAIWGKVDWADKAMNAIAEREWRFHSPVYIYRRGTSPMEIQYIYGSSLVHRPNLDLAALNSEQDVSMNPELLKAEIFKALGLNEDADLAAALNSISALTVPQLDKYVPRADYDQVLTRATNAEAKLVERDRLERDAAANALVDGAVAAGKIAPASKSHFLALAMNSIDAVKAFIETAPVVVAAGADAGLAKSDVSQGENDLTEFQKALCSQIGLSEAEYKKAMA